MKRFTRLLGFSVLFLGLAACESMPEESSSGSPLWRRLQSASATPDVGLTTEDQLATRGNGMRHRRHDGRRRGDLDRHGRGEGRHGLREGQTRGPREGRRGEGRREGPPAEAITACENKAAGDACSFEIEGETVTSVCKARRSGEGPLACRAGRGTHRRHDTPAQ